MDRTMVPLVKDYYDENSFGILKDVSVSVFGDDLVPGGGPLKLPRPKLAHYYWPAYEQPRLYRGAANVRGGRTAPRRYS